MGGAQRVKPHRDDGACLAPWVRVRRAPRTSARAAAATRSDTGDAASPCAAASPEAARAASNRWTAMSALSSWTNEELEGVHANVLVDTLGTLARHRHRQPSDPIYLDGRVGRVDGLDFEEVFCYITRDSSMEDLALYEYGTEMYWIDRKRDALCGAELDSNDGDYWAASEGFD